MAVHAGLELGRETVASLMPAETLDVPGYQIARRVEPATEVGGDFYNLFPIDATSVGVVTLPTSDSGERFQ